MSKANLWNQFGIKRDWPIWLLLLGLFVVGAIVYPQLPDKVPSHWNFRGEVDGYSSKFFGAFGIPLMTTGFYVLMVFIPLLDPRFENYSRFAASYNTVRRVTVGFFVLLHIVVLAAALGYDIQMGTIVQAGVSLLFVIIGNSMGRVRHNYFFGIRTPWTLADEGVWRQTHRVGGRLFVLGGFIGLVSTWLPVPFNAWGFGLGMILAGGIPMAYSYLLYKRR